MLALEWDRMKVQWNRK